MWWLFLYCVRDRRFLLQDLVYHFACFCDVAVLPLNFGGSICHFVNRLVYHDFCVWLSHDFINLMTFCPNKKGNHTFRNKNNNRKGLFFYFFKDWINIMKKAFSTMIFFVHFMIKNLYKDHLYLYVPAIEIRNAQIRVELDWLNLVLTN